MACSVLTPERWHKFLEGRLDSVEKEALRAHLQVDCAACEEFLIGLGLDQVDETLFQLLETLTVPVETAEKMTEEESDRVFRIINTALTPSKPPLRSPVQPKREKPNFFLRPGWIFSGAGAFMLIVGFLWTQLSPIAGNPLSFDGVKGNATSLPPSLHLQFSVKRPFANPEIERGVNDGRYTTSDILFFRYDISEKGFFYLIEIDSAGRPALLYPGKDSHLLERGTHDLEENGALLELPLRNEKGKRAFIGVFSRIPLDVDHDLLPELTTHPPIKDGKFVASPNFQNRLDRASDMIEIEVTEK